MFNEKAFKSFLQSRHLKYLSIKNYLSQIRHYYKVHELNNDMNLAKFVLMNPVPIRKSAVLNYLDLLESNGEDVSQLKDEIRKIKSKQNERKDEQTLDVERTTSLVNMLLEKDKRLALIVMICFDTGLRIRSLLQLRKQDMIKDKNKIFLNAREKRGKLAKRLLTESTARWFDEIIKPDEYDKGEYLFFNKSKVTNEELDRKYYDVWKRLKNISRKLFKDFGISFHWLRRGAGAFVYEKTGNDLVAVSEFFGHTDPQVTKTYLRIQAKKATEVIEKAKRDW